MAGTALHWRTVSTTGAPSFVRQPHHGRHAGRAPLRVHASFLNPHSILGVSPTADVKEVKRAYRKLALQLHPDVCKSEEGHERFIALTQAYEMLLGRAEGKTDSNHTSASGWDFHDWYWNFRMQRSWEKQQRQAKAAAAAAAENGGADAGEPDGCGGRPPPHTHAGFKQPEARENLRSQLAGLRHRAAVRANRASASGAAAASQSWSAPESYSAASGSYTESDDVRQATASTKASSSSSVDGDEGPFPAWSWSWSWDETLESDDERGDADAAAQAAAAAGSAAGSPAGAVAADLHHQYTHVYDNSDGVSEAMAMHDGHLGTVLGAANHAVPFPGGAKALNGVHQAHEHQFHQYYHQQQQQQYNQQQQQQQQQQHVVTASGSGSEQESDPHPEPEPEPFSQPFDAQAHRHSASRRRFVADSGARESVSHQLAGLRRKAAIKTRQWAGAGSADSADGL